MFDGSNLVKPLSDEAIQDLESGGTTVVESQEGLVVLELPDYRGERVRIAALNEHTDLGTDVIGLAFLREADISVLEARERDEVSLFRPATAYGHSKDQSHYHYFYNCSYIYQQGGTYGMSWYMCPNDTYWDRLLGYAIAGVLGIPAGPGALLRWLGGMLIGSAEFYFYGSDGSLRGSISDWRSVCGWVLWNTGPAPNHWMWYYCAGSTNWGWGWDQVWNKYFYVVY